MKKKVIAGALQVPLILVVIASFLASIYAVIRKIGGVGIATPIILGLSILAYFYGRHMQTKLRKDFI